MICQNFAKCIEGVFSSPVSCSCQSACFSVGSGSNPACNENGKRYELTNPQHWKVAKYHIDCGNIFSDDEKKCDYLFVVQDAKHAAHYVFVELKGTSFDHGLEQLKCTIQSSSLLGSQHISARMVARSVPNLLMSKSAQKGIVAWLLKNDISWRASSTFLSEGVSSLK